MKKIILVALVMMIALSGQAFAERYHYTATIKIQDVKKSFRNITSEEGPPLSWVISRITGEIVNIQPYESDPNQKPDPQIEQFLRNNAKEIDLNVHEGCYRQTTKLLKGFTGRTGMFNKASGKFKEATMRVRIWIDTESMPRYQVMADIIESLSYK